LRPLKFDEAAVTEARSGVEAARKELNTARSEVSNSESLEPSNLELDNVRRQVLVSVVHPQ
jgi:hypothetical protein